MDSCFARLRHLPFLRLAATALILAAQVWCNPALCAEIHDAAQAGNLEKVKALFKANPGLISTTDDNGCTPLLAATAYDRKDVIEFLLTTKSDVNARDKDGMTPLHWAVTFGKKENAELLLAKNADVNARDNLGMTPLHRAAAYDGHKEIIDLLLAAKADVHAKDNLGMTPLHGARSKEAAESLLAAGADVRARDKDDKTPLHLARNKETAAVLLAAGADVNATDKIGMTPLHEAANKDVAELLLANKADISVTDKSGMTPLDWASLLGHKDVADFLRNKTAFRVQDDKRTASQLKALNYNQALADKGDAYGQLRMGERYLKGDGVDKDITKARDYLSKAAAQGNIEASNLLVKINPP